jgi:hypothetical protein
MLADMATRPFLLFLVLLLFSVSSVPTRAEEHSGMMSQGASDTWSPLRLPAMMAEHQKQNMREHLAAVQAIIAALGRGHMGGVATASARIGYSQSMGQMCQHIGAATPGFTIMALNFHHTADGIGEAARQGDRAGVLTALDGTLQTCVGCHATYRQEIVDEATWKRLTAEAAAGP